MASVLGVIIRDGGVVSSTPLVNCRFKAGFRKTAPVSTTTIQWQSVGGITRRGVARAIRSVFDVDVEVTENGDGRTHDRGAALGGGPNEHWDRII